MKTNLNPWWVVGFVDGEGCFRASILKNGKCRFGYQIQMEFVVVQHGRDAGLLHQLKDLFQCGQVGLAKGLKDPEANTYRFRVRKLEDLCTKVVPFFQKYSLKTKKHVEFLRFQELCHLLSQKIHFHEEGFKRCMILAKNLPYQSTPELTPSTWVTMKLFVFGAYGGRVFPYLF
jgi:hypothetical protein